MRDRLRTTDWRSWFLGSAIAAVVTGVMTGVDHESVARGLNTGLFTGIGAGIFSLVSGRDRGDEFLAALSDSDRATVVRTVREGSMVGDARLAPAIIAYTENLRAADTGKWASPRADLVLSVLFALLGIWFAIRGHLDGNDAATAMWTLLTGLLVAMAVLRRRRQERRLQRLDRVERSARAFVETPW